MYAGQFSCRAIIEALKPSIIIMFCLLSVDVTAGINTFLKSTTPAVSCSGCLTLGSHDMLTADDKWMSQAAWHAVL